MSFAGGRRIMYSSLVVLLIISVLQIWVLSDYCRVGAVRLYPPNGQANEKQRQSMKGKKSTDELFRKYLHGRLSDLNTTTQNAFQDNKRRVPSCPDPLHNR